MGRWGKFKVYNTQKLPQDFRGPYRHSREGGNPNPGLSLQTTTRKEPPGCLAPPRADIPGAGVGIPDPRFHGDRLRGNAGNLRQALKGEGEPKEPIKFCKELFHA